MKKPAPRPTTATLRTFTKQLRCVLSREELADRSRDLAAAVGAIAEEEDRQQTVKADLKARLTELEAKVNRLAASIRSGVEYRDVAVELIAEYPRGMAVEYRTDTGDAIHTRPLTDDERQVPLNLEAPVGETAAEYAERRMTELGITSVTPTGKS